MHERSNLLWGKMISLLHSYRTEVFIFSGAFLVRILYAVVVQITAGTNGFIAFSDAKAFYYQEALNLVNHQVFSIAVTAPYYPEAYHTPLYPLFIAGFLWLDLPLFCVVLAQMLLWSVAVVLIYKIAIMLSESRVIALVSAVIASIEPMSIYWSGLLMSDTLFAFLVILATYFLVKQSYNVSFLVLGLAALVRPIALYFMVIFAAMYAYQMYSQGESVRNVIKKITIALALFFVILAPWSLRNKIVFNTWSQSSAGWYLFYGFPLSEFAKTYDLPVVPASQPDIGPDDFRRFGFEYTPVYKKAFFETVAQNPLGFAIVYIKRSLHGLVTDRYEYLVNNVLSSEFPGLYNGLPSSFVALLLSMGQLFWIGIYVLAFLGVAARHLWPWWLFFAALFGMSLVFSAGINPAGLDMSRYLLHVFPLFFTFAGVGAQWLWRFLVRKRSETGLV
jgi:4-amino-4-deoxy-L-arabinose transferase-like glycosyltransferase